MILLDTNVISELMRPNPQTQVAEWLYAQPLSCLFTSSITITEIMYGLKRMPEGNRKQALLIQFHQFVENGFKQRIRVFGYEEAIVAAQLRTLRDDIGQPLSFADAQIAAIARVHDFAIATRNIKDFENCGLHLINPFDVRSDKP